MIVDLIASIVAAMSTPSTFFHGFPSEANLQDETTTFPLVMLMQPIVGIDYIPKEAQLGNFDTTYPLTIFFLNKSNLSDLQVQRQPVIDALYAMKREFVVRLCDSGYVYKIISSKTREYINDKDLNLDGIELQISIVIQDAAAICINPASPYSPPSYSMKYNLLSASIEPTSNFQQYKVFPKGGNAPYTYQWYYASLQSNAAFNGATNGQIVQLNIATGVGGLLRVKVTDNNGNETWAFWLTQDQ